MYNQDGTLNEDFRRAGLFASLHMDQFPDFMHCLQEPLAKLEKTRFGGEFIQDYIHNIFAINLTLHPDFDGNILKLHDDKPGVAKVSIRDAIRAIRAIDQVDKRVGAARKQVFSEHRRMTQWEDHPAGSTEDFALASFESWAETAVAPDDDDDDLGELGPMLMLFLAHIFPVHEVSPSVLFFWLVLLRRRR
jgi:hypothetical protein